MAGPGRRREAGFDFAAEVEGIGIGIYEFIGRVALTARLTLLCPRRFRLLYLTDLRAQKGARRQVAREIPYFLFAYGLTIMLVFLLDQIALKILGGEAGLAEEFPFLASVTGKLLDLDVIAWAFVIIPVLVGLHYGIVIFDRMVRNHTSIHRQTVYEPGAVMIYFVANNIMLPTAALILAILALPMIDQHITNQEELTLGSVYALILSLLVLLIVTAVPLLLLLNTLSFIRTMSDIYGVGRIRFLSRSLLASVPLGLIASALFIVIESIFVLLNTSATASG
jgi:hypothetical protein